VGAALRGAGAFSSIGPTMRILKRLGLGLLAVLVLAYVALFIYAYWPSNEELPVSALARPEDRFITVDGVQLRYRAYGTPGADKPNVLLIHGFGNNLQSFREVAPRLADCCYVITIDLPGFGLSDKPIEHDYHNGPQARVMIDAARALGLVNPIYGGHSLGGAIALHAANADPEAGGLVLMNPGILSTGVSSIAKVTAPPLPRVFTKLFASRDFREQGLRSTFKNPELVTPAVIDDVMLAARSEGYMAGTSSMMTQYSTGEEIPMLAQVRVPTLIVWGNWDRNKPLSEADDLQSRIPGATLVRFDEAGHYVQEEQPEGVANAIREAALAWTAQRP
jgi:pimeloyl-ACP methyl ester carboxylesterase